MNLPDAGQIGSRCMCEVQAQDRRRGEEAARVTMCVNQEEQVIVY